MSNSTNGTQYGRDEFLAKFELTVLGLMFLTAVIGNLAVIIM
jgi:hypothetical protein